MRLAIMQPYTFPYLGYFQLAASVDRFVFLDDADYIRRGWINRNRILLDGKEHDITIPVRHAEPGTRIADVRLAADQDYLGKKLRPTLQRAYGKAPRYAEAMELVDGVLAKAEQGIGELAKASVTAVASFLGLRTAFVPTSARYGNQHLKGSDRILDICAREGATAYHNPPGGRGLYSPDAFERQGISLRFVDPTFPAYPQRGAKDFVPGLSILDVLMNVAPEDARDMATQGRLTAS